MFMTNILNKNEWKRMSLENAQAADADCEVGDVRVSYEAIKPDVLTAVGYLGAKNEPQRTMDFFDSQTGKKIGLVAMDEHGLSARKALENSLPFWKVVGFNRLSSLFVVVIQRSFALSVPPSSHFLPKWHCRQFWGTKF